MPTNIRSPAAQQLARPTLARRVIDSYCPVECSQRRTDLPGRCEWDLAKSLVGTEEKLGELKSETCHCFLYGGASHVQFFGNFSYGHLLGSQFQYPHFLRFQFALQLRNDNLRRNLVSGWGQSRADCLLAMRTN